MKVFITVCIVTLTLAAKAYAVIECQACYSIPATKSFAYIDPGMGSMFFQILIAGLVTFGFIIKIFWGKIKNLVKKLFSKGDKTAKNED